MSRGQEVVNTSYESDSLLAKLGFALDDAQRLKLIFRRHRQQAGELLAAYWYKNSNDKHFQELPPGVESMPQWALGSAVVHAYSANYSYTPSDNKLIDLNLGLWATEADLTSTTACGPAAPVLPTAISTCMPTTTSAMVSICSTVRNWRRCP